MTLKANSMDTLSYSIDPAYTDFNIAVPLAQALTELRNKSGALCVLVDLGFTVPEPPPEPEPVFTFSVNDNAQMLATVDMDNISFDTPDELSNPLYGHLIIKEV